MCYGLLFADRPNMLIQLYEPHPEYCKALRAAIGSRANVELFEVAIGDEPGKLTLYDEGTSSSLAGVASPSEQHKGAHARKGYEVQVARMSQFDKGDIDLLRVDVEGAEWFCLKHLVSRPKQIVVEIYNDLATYINPCLFEICEWAEQNGYRRVAVHDSDFIYER
jgi:FkbM family methyltransferase